MNLRVHILLLYSVLSSQCQDVVLITGGYRWIWPMYTAELYLPSSGLSCSLPRLPGNRWQHTQESSGLICGGFGSEDTCIQWSPATGTWEDLRLTLDVGRNNHVSWTPSNGTSNYLMGGDTPVQWRTTTLLSQEAQEPGFQLKYHAE